MLLVQGRGEIAIMSAVPAVIVRESVMDTEAEFSDVSIV